MSVPRLLLGATAPEQMGPRRGPEDLPPSQAMAGRELDRWEVAGAELIARLTHDRDGDQKARSYGRPHEAFAWA